MLQLAAAAGSASGSLSGAPQHVSDPVGLPRGAAAALCFGLRCVSSYRAHEHENSRPFHVVMGFCIETARALENQIQTQKRLLDRYLCLIKEGGLRNA